MKSTKFTLGTAVLFLLPLTMCDKEKQEWVYIDPIQCLGNPWEQDWLESHDYDDYPTSDSERLEIFEDYYEKQSIEIYETNIEVIYEDVCAACPCPTGERISCLIDESNVSQMIEWGFTEG